jgi:hypothetical protein
LTEKELSLLSRIQQNSFILVESFTVSVVEDEDKDDDPWLPTPRKALLAAFEMVRKRPDLRESLIVKMMLKGQKGRKNGIEFRTHLLYTEAFRIRYAKKAKKRPY